MASSSQDSRERRVDLCGDGVGNWMGFGMIDLGLCFALIDVIVCLALKSRIIAISFLRYCVRFVLPIKWTRTRSSSRNVCFFLPSTYRPRRIE